MESTDGASPKPSTGTPKFSTRAVEYAGQEMNKKSAAHSKNNRHRNNHVIEMDEYLAFNCKSTQTSHQCHLVPSRSGNLLNIRSMGTDETKLQKECDGDKSQQTDEIQEEIEEDRLMYECVFSQLMSSYKGHSHKSDNLSKVMSNIRSIESGSIVITYCFRNAVSFQTWWTTYENGELTKMMTDLFLAKAMAEHEVGGDYEIKLKADKDDYEKCRQEIIQRNVLLIKVTILISRHKYTEAELVSELFRARKKIREMEAQRRYMKKQIKHLIYDNERITKEKPWVDKLKALLLKIHAFECGNTKDIKTRIDETSAKLRSANSKEEDLKHYDRKPQMNETNDKQRGLQEEDYKKHEVSRSTLKSISKMSGRNHDDPSCYIILQDNIEHGLVYKLETDQQKWIQFCNIPDSANWEFYSVSAYSSGFIITGGNVDGNETNKALYYDKSTTSWAYLPSMNKARSFHGTVCSNNGLYILGGLSKRNILDSIEMFNNDSKTWSIIDSQLAVAVHSASFTVFNNLIYIFGGNEREKSASSCSQVFDPRNNECKLLKDLPEPGKFSGAVVHKNNIYIVGGENRACFMYNPDSDQFTCLERTKYAHSWCYQNAILWKKKIVVGRGYLTPPIGEEYDPEKNTWQSWPHNLDQNGTWFCMFTL